MLPWSQNVTTVVITTIYLISVRSLVMRRSARRIGKLELSCETLREAEVVEAVETVVLVLMGSELLGTVQQKLLTLA